MGKELQPKTHVFMIVSSTQKPVRSELVRFRADTQTGGCAFPREARAKSSGRKALVKTQAKDNESRHRPGEANAGGANIEPRTKKSLPPHISDTARTEWGRGASMESEPHIWQ